MFDGARNGLIIDNYKNNNQVDCERSLNDQTVILIYDAVFLTTLIKINEGFGREGSLNARAGHPPRTDAVILWGWGGVGVGVVMNVALTEKRDKYKKKHFSCQMIFVNVFTQEKGLKTV